MPSAAMDIERLLRIPDADDFRALTILDLLRAEIKQRKECRQEVRDTLLDVLRLRLSPTASRKAATEEMVLAVVQILVELVNTDTDKPMMDVARALPDLVLLHLRTDRVRRAAGVLYTAMVRKGGASIARHVCESLAALGIGNVDVSA